MSSGKLRNRRGRWQRRQASRGFLFHCALWPCSDRVTQSTRFAMLRLEDQSHKFVRSALKPSPLLATSIFALFAAGVGPGQSGGCANEISVDFAGPVDWASVATSAAPPLFSEMATGTKPDEDFASTAAGTAQLGAVDKARATGRAIIAPLIGTS